MGFANKDAIEMPMSGLSKAGCELLELFPVDIQGSSWQGISHVFWPRYIANMHVYCLTLQR